MEGHVVIAEPVTDRRAVALCQRQHLVVHVDPDHPALATDDLGGDETDLAATAAEVEHRLAGPQMP